jgi:hypothetical protein
MILTIIIVNFNTQKLLRDCLESIFKTKQKYEIQILVVDNASSDDSVYMVGKDFPKVQVIQNQTNIGFAAGNNVGLKKSKSKYFLLLNSDTKILNKSLDNLVDFMERTDFGISSCKILTNDLKFQPNSGDLPLGFSLFFWISGLDDLPLIGKYFPSLHRKWENFYQREKEVGWVSGTVMMIKKEVIDKIGLLDEKIFMYSEDVEYCLRARKAGFRIGWTNKAEIIHLGGGSLKDPAFHQRLGEFQGLLYIYRKYFGLVSQGLLKLLFYLFILIRMIAFAAIGKLNLSKVYAKILYSL